MNNERILTPDEQGTFTTSLAKGLLEGDREHVARLMLSLPGNRENFKFVFNAAARIAGEAFRAILGPDTFAALEVPDDAPETLKRASQLMVVATNDDADTVDALVEALLHTAESTDDHLLIFESLETLFVLTASLYHPEAHICSDECQGESQ